MLAGGGQWVVDAAAEWIDVGGRFVSAGGRFGHDGGIVHDGRRHRRVNVYAAGADSRAR